MAPVFPRGKLNKAMAMTAFEPIRNVGWQGKLIPPNWRVRQTERITTISTLPGAKKK